MLIIGFWWLIFSFLIFGLGCAARRVFSISLGNTLTGFDVFRTLWLGFTVLICFLQIISLFSAIDEIILIILLVVSLLSYFLFFKEVKSSFHNLKNKYSSLISAVLAIALAVAVTLILLFSASQRVIQWDAYDYHFHNVRWATEYAAVPGLNLLNPKWGFNSSFFLFSALQDNWLVKMASAHTSLSFLILLLALQLIAAIFSSRTELVEKVFALLVAPLFITRILLSDRVASLSTDLSMFVILLIFSFELLKKDRGNLIMLAGLSACLLSIKLSGLTGVFVFGLLVLYYGYETVRLKDPDRRIHVKLISASVLFFILFLSGYIARNIIISGWIFYPIPVKLLNVHLPWSLPYQDVKDLSDFIKGDARVFQNYRLGLELGFYKWFKLWLLNWKHLIEIPLLFASLTLFVINILVPTLRRTIRRFSIQYVSLLILSGSSLVLWFSGAPNLRFGEIYFYIFAISAIYPLIYYLWENQKGWIRVTLVTILLLSLGLPYTIQSRYKILNNEIQPLLKIRKEGAFPLTVVKLTEENPPLYSLTPKESNHYVISSTCGNSRVPCIKQEYISYVKKNDIRQRTPGDLSKGFKIGPLAEGKAFQSILQNISK